MYRALDISIPPPKVGVDQTQVVDILPPYGVHEIDFFIPAICAFFPRVCREADTVLKLNFAISCLAIMVNFSTL